MLGMMNAAQGDAHVEHFPYRDRASPFSGVIEKLKEVSDIEDDDEESDEDIPAATAGAGKDYRDSIIHEDLDPGPSSTSSVSAHTNHKLTSSSSRTAFSVRAVSSDEIDTSAGVVDDDHHSYQQRSPREGNPIVPHECAMEDEASPDPSQDQQSDEDLSESIFRDIEQSHGDQPKSPSWRSSRGRKCLRPSIRSSRIQKAQTHLKLQRANIARDPDSHYIEIPEFSSPARFQRGGSRHKRVLKGRDDPKEVLMDLMFPGEGRSALEAIKKLQTSNRSGSLKRKEVSDSGEDLPKGTWWRNKKAFFFR